MTNLKDKFLLSKEYRHLNHGSFGACPEPIFNNYQYWQLQLERDPVHFFTQKGLEELQKSKAALAAFLNCDPSDVVLTTNPTYAINIIAKSLKLEEGDEILATDHEYGALDRTWDYYCEKAGAKYIQQEIPIPLESKEQFIENFWRGYSNKTKAIFISQITSMTALIFPVKEICKRAKELGLITIVDGAHVPGHIPLDLNELEVDIYTGACHKWLLTPKGCSFLYVKKKFQNDFDPVIISWGYKADVPGISKFLDYHQQQGTRDYSSFLTLPTALKFRKDNNWDEVSKRCRQLILDNYQDLCDIVGTSPICPVTNEFLGQICSIPVPVQDPADLKNLLFGKYKIEIPVFKMRERVFMRLATQAYVSQDDIDYLKACLVEIRDTTEVFRN